MDINEEKLFALGFKKITPFDEVPTYCFNGITIDYVPEMDCYWLDTGDETQTSPLYYMYEIIELITWHS